jgi:tRNA pseudouridine38-40 synthase
MSQTNRYFIKLAYNGAVYHGWQWQENAITVQQVLEEGLSRIFDEKISVTGAGRTDTGVHARLFFAHFDIENTLSRQELDKKVYKMNSYLPKDICIIDIFRVANDAHARFDAVSRTYEYTITTRKDPFNTDSAWYYYGHLDVDIMNEGAGILKDYTDFTSFSKLHTQVNTNNCKVMEAYWEKREHLLIFSITADRFLRNMVRAIVGTLTDLGRGHSDIEALKKIIEAKDRSEAGLSVPAHGLYLVNVEYPDKVKIKN